MNKRYKYLDALRSLATFLVMWQHFVGTGTFEGGSIQGIIEDSTVLPLIPNTEHVLYIFEVKMMELLGSQPAIIGVLLLFLISGYLVPKSMENKSRIEFLINRIFRIFPVLFLSVILSVILGKVNHGITFSPQQFFTSITMTNALFQQTAILTVTWTLLIEIIFYVFTLVVGKFDMYKILVLEAIILFTYVYTAKHPQNLACVNLAFNFKFVSFMLIGTTIYLAEKVPVVLNKILMISSSIIISYVCFNIHHLWFGDQTAYGNLGSFLISIGLFIISYSFPQMFAFMPAQIETFSKIGYSIYLTHTVIGFNIMYELKILNFNAYIRLLAAFVGSFLIAKIVYCIWEKPWNRLGNKLVNKVKGKM